MANDSQVPAIMGPCQLAVFPGVGAFYVWEVIGSDFQFYIWLWGKGMVSMTCLGQDEF